MDAATPVLEAALSNSLVLVRAGKTKLPWASFFNPGNAVAYIQLFDAVAASGTGSPTLGSTAPNAVIGIAAGLSLPIDPQALGFVNGLVVAATTTPTGSTAPNAPQVCTFGVKAAF
jgi:hypothetical protein